MSASLHDALTLAIKVVNHNIFEKFNSLNKQLQENNSDLISSKSAIAAFLRKLQLYKNNIRRRAFEQFPCLACINSDLQDEDLALYGEYLENIHEDMQTRVGDLLGMDIPIWVSIPFEVNVAEIDISLQEPLNEIQNRNRLNIMKRGDPRLSLTSIEPNINKLAEKNQPQGSH
ncbi:hypothetical protein QYM36_013747 [Artemia franciscana]|uniref:Uncharacterized protein n=1 Tax=Artemia franciscana TaxID=6661 RepID=A0AA88HJH8_ARTSF|nr:hypothetical protein QYM36_013747 [Artemia franciscana]